MDRTPLLSAAGFHAIVSGRRTGLLASCIRAGLAGIAVPYAAAVAARNAMYDRRWKSVHTVDAAVISVGNLTLGGTGKTPLVAQLAHWFKTRSRNVAIVSRGYGRPGASTESSGGDPPPNDEAMELARRCPGVPHIQSADRVAAARRAIETVGAEILILDDAFQHRRIARDLDIVLLDAYTPFGYDRIFPHGTLREPVASLRRADVVLLTRANSIPQPQRDRIAERVRRLAPHADWGEIAHVPECLVDAQQRITSLDSVRSERVAAFCGIGNPDSFRHTLAACGYDLVAFRSYPDHHRYANHDIESLDRWARKHEADVVLCTEKDLVKLTSDALGDCPLAALRIGLRLLQGQQHLERRLESLATTNCPSETRH